MEFGIGQIICGALVYACVIGCGLVITTAFAAVSIFMWIRIRNGIKCISQHIVCKLLLRIGNNPNEDIRPDVLEIAMRHGMSRKDFCEFLKDVKKLK